MHLATVSNDSVSFLIRLETKCALSVVNGIILDEYIAKFSFKLYTIKYLSTSGTYKYGRIDTVKSKHIFMRGKNLFRKDFDILEG